MMLGEPKQGVSGSGTWRGVKTVLSPTHLPLSKILGLAFYHTMDLPMNYIKLVNNTHHAKEEA